ncbi:MAG: hypothetical protein LBO71_09785 [Prevotellaceae bacterium]|nr:hypothetical protein [Prevotellaceae bacterium]
MLLLISCAGMSNAFSQTLFASYSKESWGANKTASAKAEAKSTYKWEFYSVMPDSFDASTFRSVEEDDLGQRVACLKTLVDKYYIHKEEIVPGDPTLRTIIHKPNIYNAARKVEKHLKKEIKRGNLTVQQAAEELAFVLEVAIAAIDEADTQSFESSLRASKGSADQQISVFKQVKINRPY